MSEKYKLGILATHPIQYYVPWYQALAQHPQIDLHVFYCHDQTAADQADAGFNVPFTWDIPLLDGYRYQFLENVATAPNVNTFSGCDTPEIQTLIKNQPFDALIIQGWYTKSAWQAFRACWQKHTPLLIRGDSHLLTQRSALKRWLKYPFYRWFIPRFDAYLVVGQLNRAYYLHYGASPDKLFFVPHAVDNTFFASQHSVLKSQRQTLRDQWQLPQNAVVFLFAGKLIPHKYPHHFVDALSRAHQSNPHIYGLVVGDGDWREKLEQRGDGITYAGFLNQSAMPQAFAAADMLVLPGDETWGLVVNEAMGCGVPALVSDQVGCAPDLVIPGHTGALFPFGDTACLAELMVRFAAEPDTLQVYGKAAAAHIQRYSIGQAVAGTLDALHAIKPQDD